MRNENRKRNIKKQIWLNEYENNELKKKAQKVGISESEFVRILILGCVPREKPDDRFYEVIKELRRIGNNINQIAYKANAIGIVDIELYKNEVDLLNTTIIELKKEYLPVKIYNE